MKKYINTIIIGTIAIGTEVTKEVIGDRWDSFIKDGYIVEAPKKVVNEVAGEGSDCSELQTELESAKEAIATKDEQIATLKEVIEDKDFASKAKDEGIEELNSEKEELKKELESAKEEAQKAYGELVEELAAAEKIADLKALQAKYPVEA